LVGQPLIQDSSSEHPTMLTRRPIPALSPAQSELLERARTLRRSGQHEAARRALATLLGNAPHHPLALIELAGVHGDRRAWRAVETLARAERAATHDSLLLAPELTVALERLARPREAAEVVLEACVADDALDEWANAALLRLATTDPRGVRELLRRTAERISRPKLARSAARLEWRGDDLPAALQMLARADRDVRGAPSRWSFADELLAMGTARDSSGGIEVLFDLTSDPSLDANQRLFAARRAWQLQGGSGSPHKAALRLTHALRGVPPELWGDDFLLSIVRDLRQVGFTTDARALMAGLGSRGSSDPELRLERALSELRDGLSDRVLAELEALATQSEEAAFRHAEALFFAGRCDSALARYERVARDPQGPYTGAALERIFLLEDAEPRQALPLFGRLAYQQWRGESKPALALADSLYRTLPRGTLWAHAALALAAQREAAGDGKAALEPLLAAADSMPTDQLAPLARQRAGDVLRTWFKDDARALEQYEECLSRYPKAWNAPEVRRAVESLRRERRF
jgi:tetratricopeptide (TPR) repeat protein